MYYYDYYKIKLLNKKTITILISNHNLKNKIKIVIA